MARFTLPRDLYHGPNALEALKTLPGKRAMICVGGGISNEGENLLQPLRRILERERYSLYAKKQTKVVKAVLGNDAGVIGAALLNE